eukprot:Colp12_sorted_trinity150504_noHs@6705
MAFIKRAGNFVTERLKTYAKDYWTTVKGVGTFAKEHPFHFALNTSVASGLLFSYITNPSAQSYYAKLTEYENNIMLLAPDERNEESAKYIKEMSSLHCNNVSRWKNFIFFSLVVKDEFNPECQRFRTHLPYLLDETHFWEKEWWERRVVDVGAFGQWFILEKKMVDYDVPSEDQ